MKVSFSTKDVAEVKYSEIQKFKNAAKKERVTLENPKEAKWYAIKDDDEIVSFYCFVHKGKTARFKSNYTVPAYRKNGALSVLIKHAKEKCKEKNVDKMTAYCTEMSVRQHIKNGAVPIREKNGITFVRYEVTDGLV